MKVEFTRVARKMTRNIVLEALDFDRGLVYRTITTTRIDRKKLAMVEIMDARNCIPFVRIMLLRIEAHPAWRVVLDTISVRWF